jgi:hypothetical protein
VRDAAGVGFGDGGVGSGGLRGEGEGAVLKVWCGVVQGRGRW